MLEPTVTIAIPAILIAEDTASACRYLHSMNLTNEILGLYTIGTDILHSRSTHIARNQREVLQAVIACLDTECHDVVPHLSTATDHTAVRFKTIARDTRAHHDTLKVFRQQQITTATYYYIRCIRRTQDLSNLLRLLFVFKRQETTALGINTKCVMRLQTIVYFIYHVAIFISSQRVPYFLKRSSISSPLATPRIRKII